MQNLIYLIFFLLAVLITTFIFMTNKIKKLRIEIKKLIKENENENKSENIISDDLIFKTDEDLIITSVNDNLLYILGFAENELVGKSIIGTIIEDKENIKANLKRYANKVLKKADIINSEMLIIDKKGETHLVYCHQRPILNEILQGKGICFVCKNIAQNKELKIKATEIKNIDALTEALNKEAFIERLDYNRSSQYPIKHMQE